MKKLLTLTLLFSLSSLFFGCGSNKDGGSTSPGSSGVNPATNTMSGFRANVAANNFANYDNFTSKHSPYSYYENAHFIFRKCDTSFDRVWGFNTYSTNCNNGFYRSYQDDLIYDSRYDKKYTEARYIKKILRLMDKANRHVIENNHRQIRLYIKGRVEYVINLDLPLIANPSSKNLINRRNGTKATSYQFQAVQ